MMSKIPHKIPPYQMTPMEQEFARLRYEVGMNLAQIREVLKIGRCGAMAGVVAEKMQLRAAVERESRKSGSTTANQAHGRYRKQYIQG